MSWRMAAHVREMFVDLAATDGQKTFVSRALNRKDNLASGFAEALACLPEEAKNPSQLNEAVLFLYSDIQRITLRENWGSHGAFLTTEGFENLLEVGDQTRANPFGFATQQPLAIMPKDLCYGITERILASGTISTQVDPAEIEFVVSKLSMSEVKSVAICFLNSPKNPENEEKVAALLKDKGYEVFCSHSLEGDERQRSQLVCHQALTSFATKTFLESIAALGFSPKNIHLGTLPLKFQNELNEEILHLECLEDRIFVQTLGPQSKTPLQSFELKGSPLLEIHVDEHGLVHVGPQKVESEPGPLVFGKGIQLTLLDILSSQSSLSTSGITRLKFDLGRLARPLAALAKQLRIDVATCVQKYAKLGLDTLAFEVKELGLDYHKTVVATGWMAPVLAPHIAKALNAKRLILPQGAPWASTLTLLENPPTKDLVKQGNLIFEKGSLSEGTPHDI